LQAFLWLKAYRRDEAYRPFVVRSFAISFAVHCRRSAVEREFENLKHNFGLTFLRVRGIERVRLHADLVMLGRLAQALSRARSLALVP